MRTVAWLSGPLRGGVGAVTETCEQRATRRRREVCARQQAAAAAAGLVDSKRLLLLLDSKRLLLLLLDSKRLLLPPLLLPQLLLPPLPPLPPPQPPLGSSVTHAGTHVSMGMVGLVAAETALLVRRVLEEMVVWCCLADVYILANSVVETRNEMDIRNNSVKSPRRLLGAVHSPITAPRSWSLQQRFSGFRQTRTGSLGTKESRPRGHHAPVDSPSLSRSRGAAPRAHFGHRVHGLQSILPGELLPMHLHFPALTLPLTVSAQLLQT